MTRTIDQLITDLKSNNQSISDLNAFADMKTTQEDRKMILTEWAKLSQERKRIIDDCYGR